MSTNPSPTSTAPEGIEQALQLSRTGDGAGAIRFLRDAAEREPRSAVVRLLLGAELAQAGALAEAEAWLAEALLCSPELHVARFQLGLVQYTSGRVAVARITWQPLLGLGAQEPLRDFVLAFEALAGDRFDEALAHLQSGIALNETNAPLNADMQRLADRIAALRATPGAGTTKDPGAAGADDAEGTTHVLLSNYAAPR
jgi:tetratricopeptide (TPR) repeat protein